MLKKIIIFLFLVSTFQLPSIYAENIHHQNSSHLIQCSPELEKIVKTIQQLPEVKELIHQIQKEGAIKIMVNPTSLSKQFGAFWDPDHRTISVNVSNRSKGEIIGSILFELQNALVNSKINFYDDLAANGKIQKENYVREMERLEYHNSLKASKLAEKGIRLGIFPSSAHLPTYNSFEEHYYYQQVGGHSAWVENNFNQISRRS